MEPLYLLVMIAAVTAFASIPATIASRKGRSFAGFYVLALFLWLVALIVALVIKDNHPVVGDTVVTVRKTALADGGQIPTGVVAQVLAVKVLEGTPVVSISTNGSEHWLARSAVKKA